MQRPAPCLLLRTAARAAAAAHGRCTHDCTQRRLGLWAYTLIVAASIVFWFASLADCSRAAFQYYGLPTTEVHVHAGS